MMKIGLTYDLQTNPADERQVEFDPPATIQVLTQALQVLGCQVVPLGNAGDLLREPRRLDGIELVFNLAEGGHGRCREAWVPTLLELAGVPYVGSDPLALMIGLDKVVAKRLAVAEGIATPRWIAIERPASLPATTSLAFPLIVKPRSQGSGRGIDARAVVADSSQLDARVRWLSERLPEPILIEEFIPRGELTIFVIGNAPPVAYPAIQRPIDPDSRLSCHVIAPAPSVWECPVTLDEAIDAQARRLALTMFKATTCRDMARVDLRVDARGTLWFLEINPLPTVDPGGSLGLLAEYLGTTYAALISRILEAACRRLHLPVFAHG